MRREVGDDVREELVDCRLGDACMPRTGSSSDVTLPILSDGDIGLVGVTYLPCRVRGGVIFGGDAEFEKAFCVL